MAVDGKHSVGRAAEVLDVYQEMGCDIIGLQETRRSGQSALLQAGYVVYCSGESGGDGEGKKGQGGLGLAVRKSISRAEARPPECISGRLLKVTLELCGRARAVTFVVGYAPTDTQSLRKKNAFWTALERVVKEVQETAKNAISHTFNGRGKSALTTLSRGSETENSCGMSLCTPNRHSYLSRITKSSQHMLNCLVASLATDR